MNPDISKKPPPKKIAQQAIEVWGGLECTVARVGNHFRDQSLETGHFDRLDDLEAIASLGIRTLRYPVLWETISPDHPDEASWRWHDERLGKLRQLGIDPIAGLVHHGSGPHYTNLLDPAFPDLLARHAERVARRYPWLNLFTPINEPLTTARFSGLYGHWYPHGKDTGMFLRALITQCRAVVLGMRAVRSVIPHARLVQTEDLGKTFSTSVLHYQADYENERRWLSFDLLCGRIDRSHSWYRTFIDYGIREEELDFFIEEKCPPDIMGINHYLTSERYLDHRIEYYPHYHQAGNGSDAYADAEAVRIDLPEGITGPRARLREAWERYGLPLAVTEAHHGCSRDEQLRWLMEVWNATVQLKSEGVDMRAVTVWAMLGAVDWNTLLVQRNGFYEPGVFDIRSGTPRPTVLATATASLASKSDFDHPVLDRAGWWRREERFYRPVRRDGRVRSANPPRRLAITGATGTLGQAFSRICDIRGLDHDLLHRGEMDIADHGSVEAALAERRPWAVINTAGYVRVAEASRNAERCYRENAHGAEILARACAQLGIPFVTFSSDLVFDGQLGRAYVESDAVCPACVYGNSKAEAERRVLNAHARSLVIRTSAFFGPWDRYSFIHAVLRDLSAGCRVEASDALLVSPTYVPDLVHGTLDLLIDGTTGVWHLTNREVISWHALASRVARRAGVNAASLAKADSDGRRVTALSSERGLILPDLDSAIERFLRDATVSWNTAPTSVVAVG